MSDARSIVKATYGIYYSFKSLISTESFKNCIEIHHTQMGLSVLYHMTIQIMQLGDQLLSNGEKRDSTIICPQLWRYPMVPSNSWLAVCSVVTDSGVRDRTLAVMSLWHHRTAALIILQQISLPSIYRGRARQEEFVEVKFKA